MNRQCFLAALVALLLGAAGKPAAATPERPRLAVLLVVDQLSEAHLQRRLDEGRAPTIARLIAGGFRFRDLRYEAAPALTSPGHATLATGAYPELHGVVANEWYDPALGRFSSGVEDVRYRVLGREPRNGDGTAATRLRVGTLGESLKLRYPGAKVVGLGGKDRGAILASGPAADLALWLDSQAPRFTTSTAYAQALPAWVEAVNARLMEDLRKGLVWELPRGGITVEGRSQDWARDKHGFGKTFPHRVNEKGQAWQVSEQVLHHPMIEALVVDLAIAAVDALALGQDDQPDLLTISFSSFDKVLHAFGPDSAQAAAAVGIIDEQMRRLLEALDARVGKGRYLVALTSDHGGAPVAEVARERGVRSGQISVPELQALWESTASKGQGKGPWLEGFKGTGWYAVAARREKLMRAEDRLRTAALGVDGVRAVLTREGLMRNPAPDPVEALYRRGFFPGRSPDLIVVPEPYFMFGPKDAAGHGTWLLYDRQLPLVLFGAGVKRGEGERAELTDVAPTLARLLGAGPPSAAQGRVLREALLPGGAVD